MFEPDVSALDADATLSAAGDARALSDWAETRLLQVAAHWADLNGVLDKDAQGGSLPGMEQLVLLGGEGTPQVAEFAPAELGAELAMSPYAAAQLVGDALDLRHRLPRLWSRVLAGQVRPWIARKTAQATRTLSPELAAAVDGRVTPWAPSLSWGRLEAVIAGVVIAADPEQAAAEARRAEERQGVWVDQSTDAGIKDIYIRTQAPHAIWFEATIDRIADGLNLLGDNSTKDVRRGRAVGVIAQPQQALDLFAKAAKVAADDGCNADSDRGNETCSPLTSDPGDSEALTGDRVGCGLPGATNDRPRATLYLHLAADAITRSSDGVARFEGVGPITIEQARNWLGHCQVTIKPVVDLNHQAPVDAYEVPDRLREAVQLRSPVDVFPYATMLAGDATSTTPIPTAPPTTADHQAKPGSTTSPR